MAVSRRRINETVGIQGSKPRGRTALPLIVPCKDYSRKFAHFASVLGPNEDISNGTAYGMSPNSLSFDPWEDVAHGSQTPFREMGWTEWTANLRSA